MKEGRYSNAAKLDIHQVKDIQKRYESSKVTMKELANEYNVTMTTICRLVKDIETDNKKRGTGAIEHDCNFTKLSNLSVKRIMVMRLKYGMTQITIAKLFDIDQSTVSNICTGKSWKHLFQGAKEKYNKEILNYVGTKKIKI
jgi:DNA-binding XRE family transcriptional regulator